MVNKKQSNKDINIIQNNKGIQENKNNINLMKSNRPSNFNKYRKMNFKLYTQTNNIINSTIKKSKLNHNNNTNNSNKMKTSNIKGNKSHNLLFSSKNNNTNNLKGNISAYLTQNKNTNGIGTNLDISKSEIQYPLNYPTNEINNKYSSVNNTNSNAENNNKEINLRISLKYGNNNNKEIIKKYDITSPSNKANHSFGKKLRQSMKNPEHFNKRKNKDIYSPDIIKYNKNVKEMKSNSNNFYTKRDYTFINTFNSCINFYQKEDLNSKRKNEVNFNNTMNQYDFYNNKINNKEKIFIDETSEDTIDDNKYKYNNYSNDTNSIKNKNIISSSRYLNDENNEEIKVNNEKNNKNFLSYKMDLIEDFCDYIEEYMLLVVKDNFETFINKLKEFSKKKYLNFLLLKRLQTKSIKKKFYQIRDSSYEKGNNSYISSTINNNNSNNILKIPCPTNNLSKEYIRRKTIDNFNNNSIYPGKSENIYHRKSQEKIILKNFDSFYNNNYDTNQEKKHHKEMKVSNEKYDTNLYIPKKYRHINNIVANKNQIKKNISYNNTNINHYFTNFNKTKESSNILSPELNNNLSNDIGDEIIKSKLERNSNIKIKKYKNHNISCDNKRDIKYYLEKQILNKISSNDNKNSSMTMNFGKLKEEKTKPIYSKKKVKISQRKSKIFLNKQNQENLKQKIMHRNNNHLKKEQVMNLNLNKKINNKNRNNNEHYGIMTLSSNASESSNDIDITPNEKNEFNNISPQIQNQDINPINKEDNNKENEINIIENENSPKEKHKSINKKNQIILNVEQIKDENGNNKETYQLKEEKNNQKNDKIKEEENINNDYHIKMSNGKKEINEDICSKEYISREIIVKDVSTRDRRVNVFIKYVEESFFNQINNKNPKKHILIIFQTDSIYLPASYPSISEQRNNVYNKNKFYKNMNDKNHLNKILSSIIEEEEKSKAAGSVNNSISIISDEENLKNGNYSYFFIQSIKYFIGFLNSILSDKKKTLYFSFFKILKRIKNESFLKGLINQKKTQSLKRLKEEDNKEKNNTSGDVILYNVNDKLDLDINFFNEVKNENQNPRNKLKELKNNTSDEKYSTENNFCLFIEDNLYQLNNSNKKSNINLSMDNFYLNKNGNHKYDKNILKQIINNTKINNRIKVGKKDLKELEKTRNGQDDFNANKEKDNNNSNKDINLKYEKNITISEACMRLADLIYDFRISLIKYGTQRKKKIE